MMMQVAVDTVVAVMFTHWYLCCSFLMQEYSSDICSDSNSSDSSSSNDLSSMQLSTDVRCVSKHMEQKCSALEM
jgi:hypothetical protein